jgi:hypothetical protein
VVAKLTTKPVETQIKGMPATIKATIFALCFPARRHGLRKASVQSAARAATATLNMKMHNGIMH